MSSGWVREREPVATLRLPAEYSLDLIHGHVTRPLALPCREGIVN